MPLLFSLLITSSKLFDNGKQYLNQGDEEEAYVAFMKYISIVNYIRTHGEFQADKQFYSKMIGRSNTVYALEQAEILSGSLTRR